MVLASLIYLDSFNRYIVLSLVQSFDGLEKVMDSTEPLTIFWYDLEWHVQRIS